jgi:hypothetical protein
MSDDLGGGGEPAEVSPALFTLFPATKHHGLIVRYPFEDDSRLSVQFARAAERLATTYVGDPRDDEILLPWLYLYRHAIELTLKSSIRVAAQLRRNNGEDADDLEYDQVAKRLRRKHGHKLGPLVEDLNVQLQALELDTVPDDTMRIIELLNLADPGGMAFRYSDELPQRQDHMDFPSLNAALHDAYEVVSAAEHMLDHYGQNQADWLAYKHEVEAEMRAEFGEDMGYRGY